MPVKKRDGQQKLKMENPETVKAFLCVVGRIWAECFDTMVSKAMGCIPEGRVHQLAMAAAFQKKDDAVRAQQGLPPRGPSQKPLRTELGMPVHTVLTEAQTHRRLLSPEKYLKDCNPTPQYAAWLLAFQLVSKCHILESRMCTGDCPPADVLISLWRRSFKPSVPRIWNDIYYTTLYTAFHILAKFPQNFVLLQSQLLTPANRHEIEFHLADMQMRVLVPIVTLPEGWDMNDHIDSLRSRLTDEPCVADMVQLYFYEEYMQPDTTLPLSELHIADDDGATDADYDVDEYVDD